MHFDQKPKKAALMTMILQKCPQLTRYGKAEPFIYWGRVVAVETASVKANQCLTSTPSSTSGIVYAKLADCGSNSDPAADQSWAFLDDDFGKEIIFVSALSLSSFDHSDRF